MSVVDTLRDRLGELRASFERADRFARMRLWILGALGVDVVVTLFIVALSGGRPLEVDVRFVAGFPSNQVMLQNQGRALSELEVTIDGRYTAKIAELPRGSAVGLEMDREFRDSTNMPPPRDYKPSRVGIRSGSAEIDVPLGARP